MHHHAVAIYIPSQTVLFKESLVLVVLLVDVELVVRWWNSWTAFELQHILTCKQVVKFPELVFVQTGNDTARMTLATV